MASVLNRMWQNPAVRALLISIVAIAVGFLVPPSLPVIAILFLISGTIGFFRTQGSPVRVFWGIIALTGLIIILVFGVILLLGYAV